MPTGPQRRPELFPSALQPSVFPHSLSRLGAQPFFLRDAEHEQHTLGHLNCLACEKARFMLLCKLSADRPFSESARLWLESRSVAATPGAISARYIRPNTEHSYEQYIRSLNLFFAEIPLEKIHIGNIRAYQQARTTGAPPFIRKRRPQDKAAKPCPASAKKINQEITILKMILRRAGCWTAELEEYYEPLVEIESDIPRSLTAEEQRLWLDVSRQEERWHLVYWYSVLAFGTSMSTNEMRALRIGDMDMYHRIVTVPWVGAKNKYRQRTIPLQTADVLWACEQLLQRAKDLRATEPQHYLFPFRKNPQPFDPTRPMTVSGIKKSWNEVRSASGLTWFRPYDTRHTAITRWAEYGMPIEVAMSMAGHVSRKMHDHYRHIGQMAQRKLLDRVSVYSDMAENASASYSIPRYAAAKRSW